MLQAKVANTIDLGIAKLLAHKPVVGTISRATIDDFKGTIMTDVMKIEGATGNGTTNHSLMWLGRVVGWWWWWWWG